MAQTVNECLTAGIDSTTVINDINTNGNKSKYAGGTTDLDGNAVAGTFTQAEINEIVQRNVDHLETILLYKPVDSDDDTPNIVDLDISVNCSACVVLKINNMTNKYFIHISYTRTHHIEQELHPTHWPFVNMSICNTNSLIILFYIIIYLLPFRRQLCSRQWHR